MENSRRQKTDVFYKETRALDIIKQEVANKCLSKQEAKKVCQDLITHSEKLLKDAKVLTSVSDRLHHKLNEANGQLKLQKDEIAEINEELKTNNQVLQNTVEMLTEAKVSQKASSIVLLIAIVLFVFSEWLIEPIIERNTSSEYVGLLFKGVIALLLKPVDILVERILTKRAIKDVRLETRSRLKRRRMIKKRT